MLDKCLFINLFFLNYFMTRMWCVSPALLCRNHLLGFHKEIHQLVGEIAHKRSEKGRIFPVVHIEIKSMAFWHEECVKEMLARGYNHYSPITMPDYTYLPQEYIEAKVNPNESIKDLKIRCEECRKRIENKKE